MVVVNIHVHYRLHSLLIHINVKQITKNSQRTTMTNKDDELLKRAMTFDEIGMHQRLSTSVNYHIQTQLLVMYVMHGMIKLDYKFSKMQSLKLSILNIFGESKYFRPEVLLHHFFQLLLHIFCSTKCCPQNSYQEIVIGIFEVFLSTNGQCI